MYAIETQDRQFKDGNGTSELGTILPAWWLNQVQAELLAVLTEAGIRPEKAKTNQLRDAVKKIFNSGVVNNLTTNEISKSLSASMGKKLADEKLDANLLMFSRPPVKGGSAAINLNLASKQSIISQLGDKYISFGYHQLVLHNTSDNHNIQGLPLNNRSAVQLDFALMGGYSYIVCRYILAGRQFYTQINWNNEVLNLNWVEILTANNGVMLSGDQTVSGVKTFNKQADFALGLRFSAATKEQWATLGMGASDVYLHNPISNKFLQLRDDGVLRYDNQKVMLLSDRSDEIDLDSSEKLATSKAIKKLKDKTSATATLTTQDLDVITAAGIYGQSANGNATTARHYPVQKAGTLLVAPSAYGVQQLYFPFDTQEIYNRNSSNTGGFQPWVKINVSPSEMTSALTALERKLVDSSPDALNTLRELSAALNNNPNFAAQILQQLGGKADKATTRAGYGITDASQVAVLTGQVDNGGTIPLPAGYSQAQCKWLVSMAHDDTSLAAWDIYEGGSAHNYYFECFANANRVVTARTFHGQQGDSPRVSAARWVSGRANYIIIGVK